ncbi:MAG: toprim domain-containing protein [Methylobacter sp.]
MKAELAIEAQGRWPDILAYYGIQREYLRNRHGPCPICQGRDRFRFDNKNGTGSYYCSGCGAGDGVSLLMKYCGFDFKTAANEVRKIIGQCKMTTTTSTNDTAKNEARIKKIHAGLKHITPETAAGLYLIKRGISAYPELNCYAHEAVPYYEDGKLVAEYPAMVSVLRNAAGETVTHHITYLTQDSKKLDCESPRKILPVIRPMKGAAIKLFNPMPMDVLAIAEGVETALSYYVDSGIPTWAAVNTNGMESVEIPDHVKLVHIVCDEDSSFAGQAAAYTLANRLKVKEGKKVTVIRIAYSDADLVQHFDNGIDRDFNDYLIAQKVA